MPLLADVAVPVPLSHAFTYAVPPALAATVRPGARVVCQLGPRRLVGVVLRVGERELPAGLTKVKPITALLDPEPVLPAELLEFLVELGHYYFAPIGEVLRLALPALEREQVRALAAQGELDTGGAGQVGGAARQVGGRKVAYVRATDAIEVAGSLRGQAAALLALLRGTGEQPVARLEERFGNGRARGG